MLDPAIEDFFAKRKEKWLKDNLKSSDNEEQLNTKRLECDRIFSLANWLPERAVKINNRALTALAPVHLLILLPALVKKIKKKQTFVTPILYQGDKQNDGFLRSGNVRYVKPSIQSVMPQK
ncbi:hypothetical protein [Arsenophonus endosymbiont of Aleurodicus floccissimus]|uniref:hypothetical protein n=1 Tax=Arsenophonus endosymbiont of Aleurodicus floccissimus TaxID=2152761 RepID=UPI001EE063EF|nr:hypothetical protein [Arsenophonus endosymbiont of Aleurodicus floccissimus]